MKHLNTLGIVAITSALAVSAALSSTALAGEIRSGVAAFTAGQAGITVQLTPAVDQKYSVVVQASNTAGYSPNDECTYFNVLKETPTKFEVQHKKCSDGTPVALDYNVTLSWILITHQ